MKPIYLDNNATTRVADEVFEAMVPYLRERYGNPSSVHTFGGQIAKAVEKARAQVAALINAAQSEVIFTSCGTESDNTAILGTLDRYPHRRHVVTTRVFFLLPVFGGLSKSCPLESIQSPTLPYFCFFLNHGNHPIAWKRYISILANSGNLVNSSAHLWRRLEGF